jgi:hypothetical protein
MDPRLRGVVVRRRFGRSAIPSGRTIDIPGVLIVVEEEAIPPSKVTERKGENLFDESSFLG